MPRTGLLEEREREREREKVWEWESLPLIMGKIERRVFKGRG
jgi:hypothetical protein